MSMRKTGLTLALAGLLVAGAAGAATYTDNFTGGRANLNWTALNDACLTAGNGSGSIPACPGTSPYPANDTPGQGALLLTPASAFQTGAILSAFPPFPLSQGIRITFTTYTFAGNSGGLAGNGADGIVFFMTDGTQATPTTTGGSGGSMGYDCSNVNAKSDGVAYGYLGLGIDEYGNFLNSGDNGTNPQVNPGGFNGGIYNSNDPKGTTANGTNTFYNANSGNIVAGTGPQYQPERIGLRGSGNTNWAWLQSVNPTYYSGAPNSALVQTACRRGQYVSATNSSGSPTAWTNIPYNYNAIPGGYAVLPNSQPIANNSKLATRNPTASTPTSQIAWPITYKLTISPNGLLNFSYSYNNGSFQPVLANTSITALNGPLPASLRFGFSAGTGGSNNVHEITCFTASPLQANSSAGANTVTGKVTGNTQFFLASYSSDGWWGSLVADPLVIQSNGTLSIGTDANWDAKCVLTGNGTGGNAPCDSMGTTSSGGPRYGIYQSPSSRTLLTSNAIGSSKGVSLAWSSLSSAQQTALNVPTSNILDTTPGQTRVAWLTGVRNVEQLYTGCTSTPLASPPCDMRARTYVLGDIINSSPAFVGAPTPGTYPDKFFDQLVGNGATNPENASGAQAFSTFVSNNATRLNVVYVGGNDGFLHGFEAGNYTSSGTFNTATNDGMEVVGYMPYDVLLNKAVNLANPLYQHDYLVDATPVAGDVFYGNAWHTWLVGGVGSSGKEIFALDITNPAGFAASNVIGDWDNTTLTHIGNTVGTPIIARMHNGQWAIIFGNGLGSTTTAGVYIGLIDSTTGAVTFQFLDTGVGSASSPNGIAYVSSVDLDGDHIADYLYAGDLQGNVWRFDITSKQASKWKVSTYGTSSPTPLFVATDASGNRQPITTSITALALQTGTTLRDMLYFGTGQQTPATTKQGVQYASGQQTFYGIWDWNMNAWNSASTSNYASLSAPLTFTQANLLAQTLTPPPNPSDTTHRYLPTTNVVCWQGAAATTQCPASNNQYGWKFDLPDPGPATGQNAGQREQIIYNPTFIQGAIVVNTAIPPKVAAAQCNPGLQTGWTMAFNPATGGGFPKGFFPDASGSFSGGAATVGGVKLSGVGTPTAIQYGGKSYLVTQTVSGAAVLIPTNPPTSNSPSRVSWRELVNP